MWGSMSLWNVQGPLLHSGDHIVPRILIVDYSFNIGFRVQYIPGLQKNLVSLRCGGEGGGCMVAICSSSPIRTEVIVKQKFTLFPKQNMLSLRWFNVGPPSAVRDAGPTLNQRRPKYPLRRAGV